MRSGLKTSVVGAVILIVAILASPTLAKEAIQVTRGHIDPVAAGLDQGYDISGQATMVRSAAGYTTVTIRVHGLAPNTNYEVHIHNQACRNAAGGGFYQHNSGNVALTGGQIGSTLITNRGGHGYSQIVSDFVARTEARSVVIHDANNMRLACADLRYIGVSPYTLGTKTIEEMSRSRAVAANL